MLIHRRHQPMQNANRRAFTLVEMLVAVALVLLMMTMFAEIFSLATSSMSKQKGLAELDQRQRMATTLIRADLRDRTFRTVYPFHPADSSVLVSARSRPININFDVRQGYFYISENDPGSDVDDVLQLTVTRTDGTVFYGRAAQLQDALMPSSGVFSTTSPGTLQNPNQPDFDDGDVNFEGAGVGTSPTAEIAYFVRGGTLYRRVLLVRKPLNQNFSDRPMTLPVPPPAPPPVPVPLIQPGIYPTGGTGYVVGGGTTFPQDFDYSAVYDFAGSRVEFIGQSKLSNVGTADPLVLGRSTNRFGFRPTNGLPMEFLPSGEFIGRFTHEETSFAGATPFGWPGDPGKGSDGTLGTADDTNPYTRAASAQFTLSPNGVVNAYAGGTRQGEDVLLTNVQCFDVKIWDIRGGPGPDGQPGVAGVDDNRNGTVDDLSELGSANTDDGAWCDIGHNGAFGFFAQTNNNNGGYGPQGSNNRCFDTWHPAMGSVGPPVTGRPPFRPATVGFDGQTGISGVDDDADGTTDNNSELGWPNSDDVPVILKSIQIRVRYRDVSTNLVREVTIVETLDN